MNPTSIENAPRIYEVPILLVKPQIPTIEKREATIVLQIYIQYDFKGNLNNSQSSEYPLTSSGTISYIIDPISVYLDGSSYLSTDINFDLKTLSFWFKPINVNIDNYLLSTDDNDFYIKVNSNELSIKVNTDTKNIISDFIADNWYHLCLSYNDELEKYDIYSNNSILDERIDNLISNPIILNIGKKSGVFGNDGIIDVININLTDITTRKNHSMVAIGTDIYIFGGYNDGEYLNDFYKIDTSTSTYSVEEITGTEITTISARAYHSMVAIDTDIYIFGGKSSDGRLNDFYKIDTIDCNVVYSNVLSDITERNGHSMVAIDTDIYIYGGYNRSSTYETYLNDFYKIDTINCNVVYSDNSLNNITERREHTMVEIGTDIYIFGGTSGSSGSSYLNDFYKITGYDSYFTGDIADLRLYNYSNADITTIYTEFYNTIPKLTDFTITFDSQTIGSTDMLSTVPNGITELNIINNSVLYNSTYDQGSGLYIDFTKPNLQNVLKVTITNNGTIYGRGGIGQISSNDNRREGKHAITVLNNADSITREIIIINNKDILGGGNGGYFITEYLAVYPYTASKMLDGTQVPADAVNSFRISINEYGGNAQYYNGTYVINAEQPYILSGTHKLTYRPAFNDKGIYINMEYTSDSYEDITITSNGGQDFDTSKIIHLPDNDLVTKK